MPSQATSQRVTVTVLAALWVSLGRCGESESPGPGCDYGKVSLDMDLPEDAVYWDCTSSTWPESTQRLPSIDTVFDPEPASQVCVDKPISYNHTIPNSGAYRPVGAESGEYLYCPPQRWLNNLHHGATVLLYHPCAPLHERHRLSVLARSCLPDYIITPHLQLNKHMPIALVSWGRTLELSTVASADICDWLETAQTRRNTFDGVSKTRKYNLLLTWSAGLHRQEQPRKMKESLRQCCELIIPSLLNGATVADMEFSMKKEHLKQFKEGGKSRHIRAALKNHNEGRTTTTNIPNSLPSWTNRNIPQRTGNVQNYSTTSGPSADSLPGKRTLSDPQSKMQNLNRGHTPRPTAPLGSVISETTLRTHSLGTSQSQKGRLTLHTAALQPSPKPTDPRNPDLSAEKDVLTDSVKSAQNPTVRPEAETVRSKDEGTDSVKHKDKDFDKHSMKVKHSKEKHFDEDRTADGKTKHNEVVDVKEREVEHKEIHSDRHSHRKSENTGFDSVAKSKSEFQPQQNPQPTHDSQPDSLDCDSCKEGEQCDCNKALGAETRAAVSNKGLPRTPRTDEAVWAAAALGFLLVLLTLSVLHTRLYRHWRTTPSLYWHDPRQDYDSVADVIRRRLRIANRRRKRGRRQECVLLPSSSSSDEHP